MQIAGSNTGLTLNDNSPITFTAAVTAINALRDVLGGTKSSSVENGLTRTPTPVTGVTSTNTGPNLFAVDANSVAFTRIPVSCYSACCDHSSLAISPAKRCHLPASCNDAGSGAAILTLMKSALTFAGPGVGHCLFWYILNTKWVLSQRNSRYALHCSLILTPLCCGPYPMEVDSYREIQATNCQLGCLQATPMLLTSLAQSLQGSAAVGHSVWHLFLRFLC